MKRARSSRVRERYGAPRAYTAKHAGTLIVLGSGESAIAELDVVIVHRPEYMIASVGHAAGMAMVDFVVSDHYEVHEELKRLQRRFHPDFSNHCTLCSGYYKWSAIDYWWEWPRPTSTSAWTAIRIGLHCGFAEIILCGVPMEFGVIQHPGQREKDGYLWPPPQKCKKQVERVKPRTSAEVLDGFRQAFVEQCLEFKGRVMSMSGFTRAVLGAPKDLEDIYSDIPVSAIAR